MTWRFSFKRPLRDSAGRRAPAGHRIGLGVLATMLILASIGVAAGAGPAPGPRLKDAWARRTPPVTNGGRMGSAPMTWNTAVYLTIDNRGGGADTLLGATSDAARSIELHETTLESGMAMMAPVDSIGVPAGGTVVLKPEGHHLMLLEVTRALTPDSTIRVTLIFERAGRIPVSARVR
jgi:copper(I)-binding protein